MQLLINSIEETAISYGVDISFNIERSFFITANQKLKHGDEVTIEHNDEILINSTIQSISTTEREIYKYAGSTNGNLLNSQLKKTIQFEKGQTLQTILKTITKRNIVGDGILPNCKITLNYGKKIGDCVVKLALLANKIILTLNNGDLQIIEDDGIEKGEIDYTEAKSRSFKEDKNVIFDENVLISTTSEQPETETNSISIGEEGTSKVINLEESLSLDEMRIIIKRIRELDFRNSGMYQAEFNVDKIISLKGIYTIKEEFFTSEMRLRRLIYTGGKRFYVTGFFEKWR